MSVLSRALSSSFLLAFLIGGQSIVLAQAPASAAVPASISSDEQPRKNIEERLGMKVDAVTRTTVGNLYEVRVGNEVVYTDAAGDYLLKGNIIDLRSHVDLTSERENELLEASLPKVKLSDLPLSSAIKIVKGNGKRTLVAFEDPNCGYCKRLEKSLDGLSDVTLYVFLFPILGDDSVAKAKAIWCSPDRARAWVDWMHSGTASKGNADCDNPIQQNVALGEKLAVTGTPTLFFASGKRVPGAIALDEITKQLGAQ